MEDTGFKKHKSVKLPPSSATSQYANFLVLVPSVRVRT